jgi:hypothetical protein
MAGCDSENQVIRTEQAETRHLQAMVSKDNEFFMARASKAECGRDRGQLPEQKYRHETIRRAASSPVRTV